MACSSCKGKKPPLGSQNRPASTTSNTTTQRPWYSAPSSSQTYALTSPEGKVTEYGSELEARAAQRRAGGRGSITTF